MHPISNLSFSAAELREAALSALPSHSVRAVCDDFFVPLGKQSEELRQRGLTGLADAFQFLGAICSLRLKPDNPQDPFAPMMIAEFGRSPILDDFSTSQIESLAPVIEEIDDFELRARLADVVWLRRRDYKIAHVAVDAYCQSATRLLSTNWSTDAVERLERGLQIAAMLGPAGDLFKNIRERAESLALKDSVEHHVIGRLLEVLLDFPSERPAELAAYAEFRSAREDVADKLIWQRRFWELAAKWHGRAREPDSVRRAKIEIAKTFECEAELAEARPNAPSALVAAHFFEQAIQAYRQAEGTEVDRERLHKRLLGCQKRAIEELPTFTSEPVDLTGLAELSRALIRGESKSTALERLARACLVPSKAKLRHDAEASIDEHPLAFLFPATSLSNTGKVIAKQGTMSSASADDRESLILRQMFSNAARQQALHVTGILDPMRRQLLRDHCVRHVDLLPFVSYSSFIPQGREQLFLLAIHSGLHGNLTESLHIAIPQFEHAIRELLANHEVLTSGLDSDGIQMERDLNSLLYEPKLEELLGEDLVFDLRGLLVEQVGANYRNRLAHGLLEASSFGSSTALYIWWTVFRLCFLTSAGWRGPCIEQDDLPNEQ